MSDEGIAIGRQGSFCVAALVLAVTVSPEAVLEAVDVDVVLAAVAFGVVLLEVPEVLELLVPLLVVVLVALEEVVEVEVLELLVAALVVLVGALVAALVTAVTAEVLAPEEVDAELLSPPQAVKATGPPTTIIMPQINLSTRYHLIC